MSTSSISSACSRTSSGRRSWTGAPVIVSTASATDSRCWTLSVVIDVDPGVADALHVLPALLGRAAGSVRVGQLVDQGDRRVAGDHRVGVHLLDDDVAVGDAATRDDLQALDEGRRVGPAVGLDEADDHVGPASLAAVALLQHPEGLADARGHPEVDAEATASGPLGFADPGQHLLRRGAEVQGVALAHRRSPSRSRLTSRTLTRGLAQEAEERLLGVAGDRRPARRPRRSRGRPRSGPPGTRRRPG